MSSHQPPSSAAIRRDAEIVNIELARVRPLLKGLTLAERGELIAEAGRKARVLIREAKQREGRA
jgi:hypothetical protein